MRASFVGCVIGWVRYEPEARGSDSLGRELGLVVCEEHEVCLVMGVAKEDAVIVEECGAD